MQVIAVVGTKNSGKTTTIEYLVSELTKRGHRITVIKHISKPDFTIDTPGKDTWKFAKAGAKTIISVAQNEVAKIEKIKLENFQVKQIPGLNLISNSRNILMNVKNLKIGKLSKDELNPDMKKIKLSFTLEKGSYATILIKCLFQ